MMRSLYSGISGLRNHQTRMDVIGNNVSNVNTTGFKASRTIFQDIFSQTLSSGMANTGASGGTNPVKSCPVKPGTAGVAG
jgi:flagellar hook protein FlgE